MVSDGSAMTSSAESTMQLPSETPPTARIPISSLSQEEMDVLLECRRKSLMRGALGGLVSFLGCKVAQQMGYLRKGYRPVAIGVTLAGFLGGVLSTRTSCEKKMLALEGSLLAKYVTESYARAGKPLPPHVQRHEMNIRNEYDLPEHVQQQPVQPVTNSSDPFDAPLNKRLQRNQRDDEDDESSMKNNRSSWDQIQKEARANEASKNRQGVTHDDLRLKRGANVVGDHDGSFTPEEKKPPYASQPRSLDSRGVGGGGSRKNQYGDEVME